MSAEQQRQERAEQVLDEWLCAREDDPGLDREDLLSSHADLRDLLEVMLDELAVADDLLGSVEPTSPVEGRALGDFELFDELGRGGMGVVWRARQLDLERDVAVKMLLQGSLAALVAIALWSVFAGKQAENYAGGEDPLDDDGWD